MGKTNMTLAANCTKIERSQIDSITVKRNPFSRYIIRRMRIRENIGKWRGINDHNERRKINAQFGRSSR